MAKKYKILFIGNFHRRSVGEPEIAKSLEQLGHEVTRLQESITTTEAVANELTKGYDFLLYSKFRVGLPLDVKHLLDSVKIPKICWLFDLYYGL